MKNSMNTDNGFSMSFLDVLSLSLIGVIVIHIISINTESTSSEQSETYITIIDQIAEKSTDHLDFIIVEADSSLWWKAREKSSLFNANYYLGEPTKKWNKATLNLFKNKEYEFKDLHRFKEELSQKFGIEISISEKQNKIPRLISINSSNLIEPLKIYVGFWSCSYEKKHPIISKIISSEHESILTTEPEYFEQEDSLTWKNSKNALFVDDRNSPSFNTYVINYKSSYPTIETFNN